jgi:addiction module HigA family antidote
MSPNSPSAARSRRQQQAGERLRPVHPGEILKEEFMAPLHLTMNRLALDLRVPVTRVAEILHERRGITPGTALRLARYFNTTAQFWMNLQTRYDLAIVREKESAGIEREVRPRSMSPDASQRN